MRCQEVRRKLIEQPARHWSVDVREHIADCEACAQYAVAEAKLSQAFDVVRVPDLTETLSLPAVRSLVEGRVAQNIGQPRWSTIMSRIARSFTRPAYMIPAAALVVAVLVLTLTPWKVDEPGGYQVAFAGVDKGLALREFGVQQVLVRLGISEANVEVGDCETACNLTITDLRNETEVGKVVSAMYKLSDCELLEVVREGDVNVNVYIPDKKAITIGPDGNITCDFIHKLSNEDLVMVDIVVQEVRFGDGAANEWVSDEDISARLRELKSGSIPCNPVQGLTGWSDEAAARGDTLKLTFDVCGQAGIHELNAALFGEQALESNSEPLSKQNASSGPIDGFSLNQNYPNPFNASTTITVTVPNDAGTVTLEVYNIRGQLVKTLADRRVAAGTHQFTWDATDSRGNEVASGVYLYRLTAGEYIETKKMALLR